MIDFVPASLRENRDDIVALNLEYVGWVLAEVERVFGVAPAEAVGMPLAEYIESVLPKVCGEPPPRGVFYLLRCHGALAGMGGLRYLRDGVAEIKRLYVRPGFRGQRLGELALARLLSDARAFGYQRICLDTGPFMKAAQRIYEINGFVDCAPYDGVEVPAAFHARWRFMEKTL